MSDTINIPAFEVQLPTPTLSKGEREYRAFLRMLSGLLKTHPGQYVAVHNEHVVDSDTDDIVLVQRVHGKIGYVPIHVGLVTDPQPVSRYSHYRERPTRSDGK
jgi:hypothetical protein